jgi:hypothetical protein
MIMLAWRSLVALETASLVLLVVCCMLRQRFLTLNYLSGDVLCANNGNHLTVVSKGKDILMSALVAASSSCLTFIVVTTAILSVLTASDSLSLS